MFLLIFFLGSNAWPSESGILYTANRQGEVMVAHPFQCRTCHEKQYDFWAKTKHASAYLVLYAKNQNFDPDCISCHTIGFQTPGGFQKITEPIALKGTAFRADPPFIETLMTVVFAQDKKSPLDSRLESARYEKLHRRYTDAIHDLEAKNGVTKNYLGVQCEHCHGVRVGHPGQKVKTLKKVDVQSCRACHRAPNAPEFIPSSISKIACPKERK